MRGFMPTPRFFPPLAALALLCSGTAVRAAEFVAEALVPPRCPDDDAANRPPNSALDTALLGDDDFQVVGDLLSGDARTWTTTLQGRVKVRQGNREISAEQFRFDEAGPRVEVRGEIEYRDPKLVVRGNAGALTNDQAAFENTRFELPWEPARGAARSLSVNRDGVLRLEGVQYTTCPEDQPDWMIEADSVSLNTDKGVGTARDARVEFFGVPLVRLPVISFPIGDARKSGLLFPSLGRSTSSGVQLSVPYYFNLAPNQDLTLTPTYYTKRGLDLEAEYRYLTRFGHGEVLANLLPGDRKFDQGRSRLRLRSITELPGDWRLTLDGENVSDARYFEDFAQGASGASIAFLPRLAHLGYRGTHLDAGVLLRNFQTLDQELPQADRPHTELPRLYARGNWTQAGALPLHWGFDAEAVAFHHGAALEGWRFDATPHVGLDYQGAGYFLKPTVALEATRYRLHDLPAGSDASPARTLPIMSLDGGLLFERGSGSRGQRRMTLEPRLMYLYVPYREQSALPVFDTAEPDLNWVELFRSNRYVGVDRVSDANQISAGVTTRLYSSVSGARFLSTTIGQTFYLRTPRVRLPDEPPVSGAHSDLIAQVELQAFRNWNLNLGMQWNHDATRTERSEVQLRYQPAPRSVVNLGYRYQRDRLEQADFSAAWPIATNWRLYGRALYSLRDDKSIEQFAGFEYSSCCWNVRAVVRDYVGRRSGARDQAYFLQLELKGLSNVGLAADAFLEGAIRGYSSNRRRR
jgi:LPS-assembly protein